MKNGPCNASWISLKRSKTDSITLHLIAHVHQRPAGKQFLYRSSML
jgi:hypothetical protein